MAKIEPAKSRVRLLLAMGFVSMTLTLGLGEMLVRFYAVSSPEGPLVGDVRLLPRHWADVAAYRRRYSLQPAWNSGVFVFDSQLGWTVAPGRSGTGNEHEKIFSGAEGTRAPNDGYSFNTRSAHTRIALVGNSYVFGQDVNYEDTWGFQLEQRLGHDIQILNFGVPAYGIDQAYLRYLKDVRRWRPKIAILGLISHDLLRTTMVYYAVGFTGALVPGAKPRFTIKHDQLTLLNVPLISPEAVHAVHSIQDLPFIDYDRTYRPTEWQPHWYEFSYLLRFAISVCSPFGSVSASQGVSASPPANQETVSLNRAILQSFVREAKANGTIPLIVFFPSYQEFRDNGQLLTTPLLGQQVLKQAGVDFVDLTDCIQGIEKSKVFTPGWHYTPEVNSLVEQCLRDVVATQLSAG